MANSESAYETVPIDSVVLDPTNARLHPEVNLEAIKGSLARFKQQRPILVSRADRIVVAGNGTLTAARDLGWQEIDIKWTDLTGIDAMMYALADNRTSELATWDMAALNMQLSKLQELNIEIKPIGFSPLEFGQALGQTYAADEDTDSNQNRGKGQGEKLEGYLESSIREIKLHFSNDEYTEVLEAFSRRREEYGVGNNSELVKLFLGIA